MAVFPRERGTNRLQVDFRFAAAGYAVEKIGRASGAHQVLPRPQRSAFVPHSAPGCRGNELFVGMRISCTASSRSSTRPAFHQRAQC